VWMAAFGLMWSLVMGFSRLHTGVNLSATLSRD
jgi:hypothetical protein